MIVGVGLDSEQRREHFGAVGSIYVNIFSLGRGLLFFEDLKARVRFVDRGSLVELGLQISFALWGSTFEDCFFKQDGKVVAYLWASISSVEQS